MIDTLEIYREKTVVSYILNHLDLRTKEYGVVTLHRPSNVDQRETLTRILDGLTLIQNEIKLVFPIHPRTHESLISSGLMKKIKDLQNMLITKPLGYLDFLKLMSESRFVITDSGGIQEETTILGIPCLTVRENTERPITVTEGTNILVGTDTDRILNGYRETLNMTKRCTRPKLWDGQASERIVQTLLNSL
jgi:UDP-N-acetylglucosamine 2-epimerase (non-hydrolysing)